MKLRNLAEKDADGMLSWMHDKEINCVFANDFASFSKEKVLEFINSSVDDKSCVHYACVDDDDNYLGTVSLKHIDNAAKNAEYAVSFCKSAQGTGAAAYATQEILRIGFIELNLERIYLNVLADNGRANHFYNKMGFVFEGCFAKHIMIKGVLKDLNWYRLLKEEYNLLHK